MTFIDLNKEKFEELISGKSILVIYFKSDICIQCHLLEENLRKLKYNYIINIANTNNGDMSIIASKFNIIALPTLLFIENGRISKTVVGNKSLEDLENIFKNIITR